MCVCFYYGKRKKNVKSECVCVCVCVGKIVKKENKTEENGASHVKFHFVNAKEKAHKKKNEIKKKVRIKKTLQLINTCNS